MKQLAFLLLVALVLIGQSCKEDEFKPLCEISIEEALDEYLTAFGPTNVQIAAYGFGGEPRARLVEFVSPFVPNQVAEAWSVWVPLASHESSQEFPGTHTQQIICQYQIDHYTGYASRVNGQKRAAEILVVQKLTDRTEIPARAGGDCPDVASEAIAIINIEGKDEIRLEMFAREWNAGSTPQTCPDVSLTDGDVVYFYHQLF